MHLSMFRRRGGGRGKGKGAAFEQFCCPLSGEFDHNCSSILRTFEFDRADDWGHLNLGIYFVPICHIVA